MSEEKGNILIKFGKTSAFVLALGIGLFGLATPAYAQQADTPANIEIKSAEPVGLHANDGKLYLYNADGSIRKDNAWVEFNGKRYFPNAEGALYRNQFISFGATERYYMGDDGSVQTGYVKAGGTVYRMMGPNGRLLQNSGWYSYDGKTYFANDYGQPYRGKILTFGNRSYLMGADGSRQDGTVELAGQVFDVDVEAGTVERVITYDLLWPVAGHTHVSSYYGWRWGRMHNGIDIQASTGTPVRAAHDGVVVDTGYNGVSGRLITILGDDGYYTNYFHLSAILVSQGQRVSAGEQIGRVGSTGRSTGPHLHFEVRTGGQWGQAHNPLNYEYGY